MRVGGLWRVEDLSDRIGKPGRDVVPCLEVMSRSGDAVLVVPGQWRSKLRGIDVAEEGRTVAVRSLGCLLHGFAMTVEDVAERVGEGAAAVSGALASLVNQGLAVVADGRFRCPENRRDDIIVRSGPSRLTELGARTVDALDRCPPVRKTEIADLIGIGRGSANRIVDRLVHEGWVSVVGGERYSLAV